MHTYVHVRADPCVQARACRPVSVQTRVRADLCACRPVCMQTRVRVDLCARIHTCNDTYICMGG